MLEAALKPKPWIRYQKVSSRFAQIRARVNVERKKQKLAEITFRFHDLRHHFAVDYLKASGNIYDLQQILGPSSIKNTELYLSCLTPNEQRKAKYGSAQKTAHL